MESIAHDIMHKNDWISPKSQSSSPLVFRQPSVRSFPIDMFDRPPQLPKATQNDFYDLQPLADYIIMSPNTVKREPVQIQSGPKRRYRSFDDYFKSKAHSSPLLYTSKASQRAVYGSKPYFGNSEPYMKGYSQEEQVQRQYSPMLRRNHDHDFVNHLQPLTLERNDLIGQTEESDQQKQQQDLIEKPSQTKKKSMGFFARTFLESLDSEVRDTNNTKTKERSNTSQKSSGMVKDELDLTINGSSENHLILESPSANELFMKSTENDSRQAQELVEEYISPEKSIPFKSETMGNFYDRHILFSNSQPSITSTLLGEASQDKPWFTLDARNTSGSSPLHQ
jgi:hypothetical protein